VHFNALLQLWGVFSGMTIRCGQQSPTVPNC